MLPRKRFSPWEHRSPGSGCWGRNTSSATSRGWSEPPCSLFLQRPPPAQPQTPAPPLSWIVPVVSYSLSCRFCFTDSEFFPHSSCPWGPTSRSYSWQPLEWRTLSYPWPLGSWISRGGGAGGQANDKSHREPEGRFLNGYLPSGQKSCYSSAD